ncbi:MAG TPA: LexA family transcriptional regulator [Dehalococcoidales bacterium]|nr:LexA family transcriptional regulator [Dehalococcoidales bacterium]
MEGLTVTLRSAIVVATGTLFQCVRVSATMSLGNYIKAVRRHRGLSQWELSRISGLSRSHISRLEMDSYESPSAGTFLSLARALKIHPDDLYQAAGYLRESPRFPNGSADSGDSELDGFKNLAFTAAPVFYKTHAELFENIKIVAGRGSENEAGVFGLYARGISLEPDVLENDIIFVEPGKKPQTNDILLRCRNDKIHLARYQTGNPSGYKLIKLLGVVVAISRRLS